MKEKIKIAVSSCLLGYNVRYDQTNKYLKLITKISDIELIPICPEITAGLGCPREPIHLEKIGNNLALISNVKLKDLTMSFKEKNLESIELLKAKQIQGFILKSKSPSCGLGTTKIAPTQKKGDGLFVSLLKDHIKDVIIIDDLEIQEPKKREEFVRKCQNRVSKA